jgi:hypothetical protein
VARAELAVDLRSRERLEDGTRERDRREPDLQVDRTGEEPADQCVARGVVHPTVDAERDRDGRSDQQEDEQLGSSARLLDDDGAHRLDLPDDAPSVPFAVLMREPSTTHGTHRAYR